MQIKRVRVIKASLPSYWYADKIGQEFEIIETVNPNEYEVIKVGTHIVKPWLLGSYLIEGDFEVLEAYYGEIIQQVTISIKRTK